MKIDGKFAPLAPDKDNEPAPDRWYNVGTTARTCEMLKSCGYEIVVAGVEIVPRDPIIHFR